MDCTGFDLIIFFLAWTIQVFLNAVIVMMAVLPVNADVENGRPIWL